jgi:hypothetical protein
MRPPCQCQCGRSIERAVSFWNSSKSAFDTCNCPGPLRLQRRACFVCQGEASHSAEAPCGTCPPVTVNLRILSALAIGGPKVCQVDHDPRHGAGGSGGAALGGLGAAALSASLSFAFPPRYFLKVGTSQLSGPARSLFPPGSLLSLHKRRTCGADIPEFSTQRPGHRDTTGSLHSRHAAAFACPVRPMMPRSTPPLAHCAGL